MPEPSTRERILLAAADLLADSGGEDVSTRAVAAAAGVQAPALYRLFGDKQGLLDAVTAHGFESYLAQKKAAQPTGDPVQDLRDGWDLHTGFGLSHPAFYVLMYGGSRVGKRPAAAADAARMLHGLVEQIALAGRLRLPQHAAVELINAVNTGVTLSLIATDPDRRDPELARRAREMVITTITTDPPAEPDPALPARALALDSALDERSHPLTEPETALLHEWLHRIAAN